ncbi:MAG TPA: di-trans,poly-cis-decaprenylcistransferase [Thermoanaerobaculia bacterium]
MSSSERDCIPPGLPPVSRSRPHVAIIMDGNGRWARARGKPRTFGHRAGAEAVRRTVKAAARQGVSVLTLYAFSADNWGRPREEVDTLLALFEKYLRVETSRCLGNGIRLRVIGRRDRLPGSLQLEVARAEARTAGGTRMLLRIAVDYSARDAILAAAAERREAGAGREDFAEALARVIHGGEARDVDLLIRTGGEQRLSDFLLWESAYAELYFTDRTWPDFDGDDLAKALAWFRGRERRFGGLPQAPPSLEALTGKGAR